MPRQAAVPVALAALLGIAAGGLVLWKAAQRRRGRARSGSLREEAAGERPEGKASEAGGREALPLFAPPTLSWVERSLGADIVVVSERQEWDRVQPLLKKELEKWPVLGMDCEWVSDRSASPFGCELPREILWGRASARSNGYDSASRWNSGGTSGVPGNGDCSHV